MQMKQLQFIDDLQQVEHQLEQGGWGSERRPNQDPLARKVASRHPRGRSGPAVTAPEASPRSPPGPRAG